MSCPLCDKLMVHNVACTDCQLKLRAAPEYIRAIISHLIDVESPIFEVESLTIQGQYRVKTFSTFRIKHGL